MDSRSLRHPFPISHRHFRSPARFPRSRRPDIGLGEVLALEQQRLARRIGERIGQAVPNVQRRRVIALAETTPSPTCGAGVFGRDRYQLNRRFLQQHIKFMSRRHSTPAPAKTTSLTSRSAVRSGSGNRISEIFITPSKASGSF